MAQSEPYSINREGSEAVKQEHEIVKMVALARKDLQQEDQLIRTYLPFIRSEASKFLSRMCLEQDDEYSIAMIAFHEAIQGYEKERGTFLSYAAMLIRSRLIDYQRRESRFKGTLSLEAETDDYGHTIVDMLADERDYFEESANLEATKQEIAELSQVMQSFGVSFSDVADNAPKQDRTLEACTKAIRYAAEHKEVLEELLRTKKLPMTCLVRGAGAQRKTLERHRKYLLAMLLIQTNGYEIIRGHLRHVLKKGGHPV